MTEAKHVVEVDLERPDGSKFSIAFRDNPMVFEDGDRMALGCNHQGRYYVSQVRGDAVLTRRFGQRVHGN